MDCAGQVLEDVRKRLEKARDENDKATTERERMALKENAKSDLIG